MLEVLAAAVAGIVVGAVLGTVGANRLVDALDSDLIHLVREIDPSTYLLAAGAVLVAVAIVLACRTGDRSSAGPTAKFDRLTVLSPGIPEQEPAGTRCSHEPTRNAMRAAARPDPGDTNAQLVPREFVVGS